MKKTMGLISTLVLSTLMFTGCQNMSASDQRIGAAALGGAVGGGVGVDESLFFLLQLSSNFVS